MSIAFVTGANGFIGQRLVIALRGRGERVRQLVWRSKKFNALPERADDPDVFVGSLADEPLLARAMSGVDVVYHLAGRTAGYRREEFRETNVEGLASLLAALRRAEPAPRRLVYVSSVMAAGPSRRDVPRSEAHLVETGCTLYGDSKAEGERMVWDESRSTGLEVVIVRPPLVYGPGDEDVLQLLRAVRTGINAQPGLRPGPVSVIYVDDLVEGLILAAERGVPLPRESEDHVLAGGGAALDHAVEDATDPRGRGIYHFTDGGVHRPSSIGRHAAIAMQRPALEVRFPAFMVYGLALAFELLGKLTGRMPSLTRDKARGSLRSWWCDDARARRELGWGPRFDLGAGTRATVAWYRERGIL